MKILVSTPDAELAQSLTKALRDAGHQPEGWAPGSDIPAEAQLAIIDGLDAVALAHGARVHILALLAPAELDLLGDCPRTLSSFVLEPVNLHEVVSRANLIANIPTWKEQTHQRLLSKMVERASDLFELATPNATLEYVNPAYERLMGIPLEEAIGKTPAQLTRSDAHTPEFFERLEATLERGESWTGVMICKARDGRLVHFDTVVTPVADQKGFITHHAAVKRDITERVMQQQAIHEANRALEQARDAAVAASRAKSGFIANMSHELRTPLNAIIGYSEMLLEDFEDDEAVAKDLSRIHTAGTHLLSLINDVLDISKIEADKIDLSPENLSVTELVESVSGQLQPLAQKNHNQFHVQLDPAAEHLYADRTRLRQVLLNLGSNACKFTKEGEVTLQVEALEQLSEPWIEFRVSDTGIGISEEQRQRLFQPFAQADSSTTRQYGGTGLGLVISKRFVEMMGGTIELESELGVGSTFSVRLPAQSGLEPDEENRGGPTSGAQPTVLMIDDDPDLRELFTRSMTQRGFRVHVATSGPQGVAFANRLRPDAIVLDVKMPEMDGWEVLSTLKLSATTASIPVIMHSVLHQAEVGKALGAVDFVVKPVNPDDLSRTLRKHIGQAAARVLLVEDDEPIRHLMRRTLEQAGHIVVEATNGAEGLEQLERHRPDIVILDLMMPVMDGFSFLERARKQAAFKDLPIVVATARELSREERDDLEAVAQRVLQKGDYRREELLERVADHVAGIVGQQRSA